MSANAVGVWAGVSAIDSNGRTIWIADAHRGDGKRFVVHADEKLTAFVELEAAIRARGELPRQAGEVFRHQAIRGTRSKEFSFFLKRSRFFSFVRERTQKNKPMKTQP